MGITIFLVAIILSFILGRLYIKKKYKLAYNDKDEKKPPLPKGEITAPDAPWLDNK